MKISSQLPRVQNGALILKLCTHHRKIGAGFQRVLAGTHEG